MQFWSPSCSELFHTHGEFALPLMSTPVPAGFPSPAEDYLEARLDLNQHLIANPTSTFFVRVSGDSMNGAGIHDRDLLIVDRSIHHYENRVVIAVLDGEFTVKRFVTKNGHVELHPENSGYSVIHIAREANFFVWGVVVHTIHKV